MRRVSGASGGWGVVVRHRMIADRVARWIFADCAVARWVILDCDLHPPSARLAPRSPPPLKGGL